MLTRTYISDILGGIGIDKGAVGGGVADIKDSETDVSYSFA